MPRPRSRKRTFIGALAISAIALAVRKASGPRMPGVHGTGPRVLVLGGGWAGIYTMLKLEKVLPEAQLTLVNRDNFFLFTPLLPEVAASAVDTRHIVNPIRRLFHRVQFVEGDVESIDLVSRHVVTHHPSGQHHEVDYDHLVLALGGITNFFGMDDVAKQSITVKTLADSIQLRNHVIQMLELADIEQGDRQKELATFLLVGGGLNGVEVVGNMNDFVRDVLPSYSNIPPRSVRIILAEAQSRLIPEMSEGLAKFTMRKLQERGVEIWLNAPVTGATEESVSFADGREVRTHTLVWVGGVGPNPLLSKLPLPRDKKGRVTVDSYLRVPDHPGIWALGDCAAVPNPDGGFYPPTAQHALRESAVAGRNIAATIHDQPLTSFEYPIRVQLAAIGHQTGVADIMGFRLSGVLPWWLWRSYYLARLPRIEKRLRVMLDWTLDFIFPRDIVQIQYAQISTTEQKRASESEEAGPKTSEGRSAAS